MPKKLSELDAAVATDVDSNDLFYVVIDGVSKRIAKSELLTLFGGGGGGGGSDLPVATAFTTITMPNPYGGADMTVVVLPDDEPVVAIAIEGDPFPRVLLFSDPSDGVRFGDGTFDPSGASGVGVGAFFDSTNGLSLNGQLYVGDHDTNVGVLNNSSLGMRVGASRPTGSGGGNVVVSSGQDDPNTWHGGVGGNVGDLFISANSSGLSYLWRCNSAGGEGVATWVEVVT